MSQEIEVNYVKEYLDKYPVMKYILPGIEHNTTEITDKCFILRQAMWTLATILDYKEPAVVGGAGVAMPANSFVNTGNVMLDNDLVGVTKEDLIILANFMKEYDTKYQAQPAVKDNIHNLVKNDNSVTYTNPPVAPLNLDALLNALVGSDGLTNSKVRELNTAIQLISRGNYAKMLLNTRKQGADDLVAAATVFNTGPRTDAILDNMYTVIDNARNTLLSNADYKAIAFVSKRLLDADNKVDAIAALVHASSRGSVASRATARATARAAVLNALTVEEAKQILAESIHYQSKVQKAIDAAAKLQTAILNGKFRSSTNMPMKVDMKDLLEYDMLYDCVKLADGEVYLMASVAQKSYVGAMRTLDAPEEYTLENDDNGNLVLKKNGSVIDKYDELNKLVKKGEYCRAFGSSSKSSPKEEAVCGEMVFACIGPDGGRNEEKCRTMFKKFDDPSKKLKGWTGLSATQKAYDSFNILKGLGFPPRLNKDFSTHTYVETDGSLVYNDTEIDSKLYKTTDNLTPAVKTSQVAYVKVLMNNTINLLPKPQKSSQQFVRQQYTPNPVKQHLVLPAVFKPAGLFNLMRFAQSGGDDFSNDVHAQLAHKLTKQLESVSDVLPATKTKYIATKIQNYLNCYKEYVNISLDVNLISEIKNRLKNKIILSDADVEHFKKEKEDQKMIVERKTGKLQDLSNKLVTVQFRV